MTIWPAWQHFEEENKGQNLLPIQFLRQLIKFYGDSLQTFVPSYLEMSMDAFASNQEKLRSQMRDAFGGYEAALLASVALQTTAALVITIGRWKRA